MNACPHCGGSFFTLSRDGDRLKLPTSMLVVHKSGAVEANCPRCKQGVILPFELRSEPLKKGRTHERLVVKEEGRG